MYTFKEYYQNKPILGIRELIDIDGIGKVSAKVDSGNEAYNVLHGVDVKEDGESVSFTTVNGKRVTKSKNGDIKIHIGSGVKENRPIIKLDITVNGKHYSNIPFSIGDRSENEDPVLLGEPFLRSLNAVIDVSKKSEAPESNAL
jgi:hypothetical protein